VYRKVALQFTASVGIAVLFLWLTIDHMVTDVGEETETDFLTSLGDSITGLPIGTLAAYVIIFLGVHVIRIWRWKYLINPLGELDSKKIFRIGAVGFAAIVILPLRLGEMVRPYLLSKESTVTMSAALGTAVVERVLDGLLITGLLFLSLATYRGSGSTGFVTYTALIAFAIFSGALGLLIVGAWRHDWTVRTLKATFGRVSEKLCDAVIHLVDGFLDGFRVLRREGVLLKFLATTALYWGLNGFGIAVLAWGFGFEISLWQAYALLSMLVIGIMIPAGPGFFGNFQFFLAQGLLLFSSPELVASAGLAFGLVLNTAQFIVQVGFAIPFFLVSQLGLKRIMQAAAWKQKTGAYDVPEV
jgi:uncharacterized protein (TIRG00374 family)